jgi:hypothetical protein
MLPTHVGVVWTDGEGQTSFEAFDGSGNSMGLVDPVAIATPGCYTGQTDEDRFFGAINPGGISKIWISNIEAGMMSILYVLVLVDYRNAEGNFKASRCMSSAIVGHLGLKNKRHFMPSLIW